MGTDKGMAFEVRDKEAASAAEQIYNNGQNQKLEQSTAEAALSSTIACNMSTTTEDLKTSVRNAFEFLNGTMPIHNSFSSTSDWENMFPVLLPDGLGGPNGKYVKISLREWVNYVLQLPLLGFQQDVNFIFYAYTVLRRHKITGIVACKPIDQNIANAVEQLARISKASNSLSTVPESTLRSILNQISFHVTALPGGIRDMADFRRNIFSMMSEYGAPTFFVTLSAADSIWPSTFIAISNGKLSLDAANRLSPKERAELLAANPVSATIAWRKRIDAFLDFVCFGKSRPLGVVKHYLVKAEWQVRCSEHAHMFFGCDPTFPPLQVIEEESSLCNAQIIERLAENYIFAWVPAYQEDPDSETQTTIYETVQKEPIRDFKALIFCDKAKRGLKDLLGQTQFHKCNKYCTNNWTSNCKSRFPFMLRKATTVKQIVDSRGNEQYRILMRRNRKRINNFHVGIINL